ncbi:MAG: DUF6265 family protein [Cyclobacteriaceae bacterium]
MMKRVELDSFGVTIALSFLILTWLSSCQPARQKKDILKLEPRLEGSWKAKAFDGELHEQWLLNEGGWMQQVGYYIEDGDTSYSAKTRIEQVDGDIILFSVIKNSNPKIFKAAEHSEEVIVFENNDYRNPYQVKYEFISGQRYRRTIKGYESDSLVVYTFDFEKLMD